MFNNLKLNIMKEFFSFLMSTIVQTIKVAPTPMLITLGVFLVLVIVVSRRKLKRIPALICIIVFALLLVQLPGFIIQYQQSFAGALTGIEWSVEELQSQQIEEEINNSRQIQRLNELHGKISSDISAFQQASGFKTYWVFVTHFRKRVYERTLEHYAPVIALNKSGWIAILIGGFLGWLFWRLISFPFRLLFTNKRNSKFKTVKA